MGLDLLEAGVQRLIRRAAPASVLRSATPMPARPSACACSTNSSPWEAPRRKEKLVVTASSAKPLMRTAHAETSAAPPPGHTGLRDRARSVAHRDPQRG